MNKETVSVSRDTDFRKIKENLKSEKKNTITS